MKHLKNAVLLGLAIALLLAMTGCVKSSSETMPVDTASSAVTNPQPSESPGAEAFEEITGLLSQPVTEVSVRWREETAVTVPLDDTPYTGTDCFALYRNASDFDALAGGVGGVIPWEAGVAYLKDCVDTAVFSTEPVVIDFLAPLTLVVESRGQSTEYRIRENGELWKMNDPDTGFLAERAVDYARCSALHYQISGGSFRWLAGQAGDGDEYAMTVAWGESQRELSLTEARSLLEDLCGNGRERLFGGLLSQPVEPQKYWRFTERWETGGTVQEQSCYLLADGTLVWPGAPETVAFYGGDAYEVLTPDAAPIWHTETGWDTDALNS